MASWASITKAAPPPAAAPADATPALEDSATPVVAVVDANAIIAGQRLETLGATRFVTIPEVLGEVRDAHSRAYLASLPFAIEAVEPNEESVRAVLRFARETGDIQALSAVDVKLLALAHMLEVAAHGGGHLREHPVQPRVRSKHRKSARRLQGWGTVPNPEDWKVVDEMEDEEDAALQGLSRIIGAVQALDIGANGQDTVRPVLAPSAALPAASGVDASPSAVSRPTAVTSVEAPRENGEAAPPSLAGPSKVAATAATDFLAGSAGLSGPVDGEEEDEEDSEGDEDAGGWQDGGKSRGAVRKQRRKQTRHATWVASHPGQQAAAAAADPVPASAGSAAEAVPTLAAPAEASAQADAADGEDASSSGSSSEEDDDEDSQEGSSSSGGSSEDDDETATTGDVSTSAAGGTSVTTGGPGSTLGGGTEAAEDFLPNTTSSVMSVTADFAMQNVLLQMGLRLVTRDGMQITRLSVWSLRCSACSAVTKEVGRLFCPKCGNMTMEKVEVTVGPEGAEYFGVRKKHCLRGTKYSLPKPKGGRQNGPILCEDVMMMRMGKKIRKMQRLQKQQEAGIAAGTVDAFAPEFGPDTWFKAQHTSSDKGAAALMAGWKHNPNERKGGRTNRRK